MRTLGISQDTGSFVLLEGNRLKAIGSYIEFKKVESYAIEISWPVQETVIVAFIYLATLATGSSIHRGSTRRRGEHGEGLFEFVTNWCAQTGVSSSFPAILQN